MQFGIMFDTPVDKWHLIRCAEKLGYDAAWVPDSQMIWSDCYATMALALANTSRIRIGTGVAITGTRIAPVTAHSIGTLRDPGRNRGQLHRRQSGTNHRTHPRARGRRYVPPDSD